MTDHKIRSRALRPDDATDFVFRIQRDTSALEHTASLSAVAIADLIADGIMRGVVIEYRENRAEQWSIGAMACSVFIRREIADDLMANPQPWVMSRLLGAAATDKDLAVLTPDEIARANYEGGLDLLLHYMQQSWDLSDKLWWSVAERANECYVRDHCGYRLRRAFQEGWERTPDLYLSTGYRKHRTFEVPAYAMPNSPMSDFATMRTLYVADLAHVHSLAPGSAVSKVFHFREPVCGFTSGEQELLNAALRNLTDASIMAELDLSRETVRKSWRRIYDRISKASAHVFESVGDAPTIRRGKEKRRLAIKYVEVHPEELRPRLKPRKSKGTKDSRPGKAR